MSAIGCTVPSTLLACVWAMSLRLGVMAWRIASGIDGAVVCRSDASEADLAGQLHGPQRPADAVVLEDRS